LDLPVDVDRLPFDDYPHISNLPKDQAVIKAVIKAWEEYSRRDGNLTLAFAGNLDYDFAGNSSMRICPAEFIMENEMFRSPQ